MVEKVKAFLRVVGHTILAFIAALVAGFTFWAFFRPIIGHQRYSQVARSPVMTALLLIVVAFWGMLLYDKWHDRRAFFAWVLPTLWMCHVMLSRGVESMPGKWDDISFFFGVGAAYSLGAGVMAIILRRTSAASPDRPQCR